MQDKLAEKFLNMDAVSIASIYISDTGKDVVNKLNSLCPNWVYEIQHEEYLEDDTAYFVTVVIYIPGKVKTGTGRSNTNFNRNHKDEAIYEAIKNALFFGKLDDKNYPYKEYKDIDLNSRIYNLKAYLGFDDVRLLQLIHYWDKSITEYGYMYYDKWVSFLSWCSKQYNRQF